MAISRTEQETTKGQGVQAAGRQLAPESSIVGRREVLRKLAVGTATLAGVNLLPNRWTTPLAEFGCLPAHAVTSGESKESAEKKEVILKSGYISIDRILRPKFVSKKIGADYGKSIRIEFNTGGVIHVPNTRHDVITKEQRVYRPGGDPRYPARPTMEVYAEPKSKATSITIFYKG